MAESVRIKLLGGFDVVVGGRTVAHTAWRLRKAKTLLKLLALEPSHRLHRDYVSEALWPGSEPAFARNNLHQVMHAVRRAVTTVGADGAQVLGLRDDLLVLGDGCQVETDWEQLESAVERFQQTGDVAALVGAESALRTDLLPEDAYDAWAEPHRQRYREWRLSVVTALAERHCTDGQPHAAVELLAPLLAHEPINEPLHRLAMHALAAAGRRPEAMEVFARLRTRLQEDLATEPERETRLLYRELLRQGTESRAGPSTPSGGSNALPSPVTELVGRSRELAETEAILARTRLLTLTGPGGAGKTALATALAQRCNGRYADGACLVELASIAQSELVVAEIARALQLQPPTRAMGAETLAAQLRDNEVLIVLDNCEHLLDACANTVANLLRGCPGVSVLATSREPLRIQGEVAWRTPSLAVPEPDTITDLDQLAGVASVRLFVQRAAAAAPGFALTPPNAQAVAEICYRLDGIPLAIELAAACIPLLSPQQITARLEDAIALLRRGDRATLTRQKTLEATLAWSYDLLDDAERSLLRRLAVFAGTFTIGAVEAVDGAALQPARMFAALGRLVDMSLVMAETRGSTIRYRLLDTVRQFARQRLQAVGEEADCQRRHCAWCVAFAEDQDPERPNASAGLEPERLDVEHDNLRAALTWALARDPTSGLRLAVALWRYWLVHGYFAEGRRWLEAVLAAVDDSSILRDRALLALAVFDVRLGRIDRLVDIGTEVVSVNRAREDSVDLALALHASAVLAFMSGAWTECWRLCAESLEVMGRRALRHLTATASHLQGLVCLSRGDLSNARALFEQSYEALSAAPLSTPPFFTVVMLGYAIEGAGAPTPRIYFEETILPGPRVGAAQARAYVLCNLAHGARLAGDVDEAFGLLRQALSTASALGDRDGMGVVLNHLGCLHRVRGEFDSGREALEQSLRIRGEIGDRRAKGLSLSNLGVLTASAGDLDVGISLLQRAREGFRENEDAPGQVASTLTLASVLVGSADVETAVELLRDATDASDHIPGNHRANAWGYALLGELCDRLGRPAGAAWALDHAANLFQLLDARDGLAHLKQLPTSSGSRR